MTGEGYGGITSAKRIDGMSKSNENNTDYWCSKSNVALTLQRLMTRKGVLHVCRAQARCQSWAVAMLSVSYGRMPFGIMLRELCRITLIWATEGGPSTRATPTPGVECDSVHPAMSALGLYHSLGLASPPSSLNTKSF